MAREKATITLDRSKVTEAKSLTGIESMSDVIDLALDQLIRQAQLRHDVAAYKRQPPTEDELMLGRHRVSLDLGDADTDYDALYGTSE